MAGIWTVTELSTKKGLLDINSEKRTLEFFKEKKAYTKTLMGIYKVDYTDPIKVDLVDTFRYELKNDELAGSYAKKSFAKALFDNKRYKIKELTNSNISLQRIDSTDFNLYIKATK